MKSFIKPGELREQISELTDQAQAIVNVAETEDRELTDDEQSQWDTIMDEKDGELVKLDAKLAKAVKVENEHKRLASIRNAANQPQQALTPATLQAQAPRVRLVNPVLRAFKGQDAIQNAYDSGMWLMALTGNERARAHIERRGIQLAQTEGTNSEGGFTVPDPLSSAIIDYRRLVGLSRRVCRVIPMTADTLNVPKRSGGLTVQYPGEATAITLSDKTWASVALTAVKRATLTKVSSELRADSIINVIDDLASEIGHAFALAEDNELVNGDGTSTYGSVDGLINDIGSAGVNDADTGEDTWAELDLQDFHDTVAILPERYHPGASWIVSRTFFHQVIEKLSVAAGISTMQPEGLVAEGASRRQFLGYPINFTDQMPAEAASTICALFGDFMKSVLIGDRGDMAISLSDHYAFNEDVITVRGTTRYDIQVHEDGDGSDAGGYVALKTAA